MAIPGAVSDLSRVRGETVSFESGDGRLISGYLARPTSAGNGHGIVVLSDAFGLGTHYPDICRRFANVGYNALAPDMFVRLGGIRDPEDRAEVFGLQLKMDDRHIILDVAASAGFLRQLQGASGKVGAIGFCAGGRQVLLTACSTDALDAGIDCWGGSIHRATPNEETTPLRPVKPIDMVQYLGCPLFVVIGAEDHDPSPEIGQELWRRMQQFGKTGQIKVYAGAGHAFFADYRPAAFREAAANELWADTLAFFDRFLNV